MDKKRGSTALLYVNFTNKKLVKLLRCLNSETISELQTYFKAPHLGLKKEEIGFFDFLVKHHPNYTQIPNSFLSTFFSANEQAFNKTLSHLTRLLEKWFIYQEIDKNPLLMNQLLVNAYADKMPPKLFLKFADAQQKKLNSSQLEHPDFLHAEFKIQSTIFHYPSTNRHQSNHSLKEVSSQLDDYFIAQKLQLICQQISRSQLVNESESLSLDQEVLRIAAQKTDNPYIQLYLNLIQLFQQFEEDMMLDIFSQLKKHFKVFNKIEASIYLQLLINYVIRLNNTAHRQYLLFQFELYKFALDKDLVIFNHQITDAFFFNVTNASCHLKEYDFANTFIDEYKHYLKEETDSPLIPLAKGIIAFHQQDYITCHNLIHNLNLDSKKTNFIITSRGLGLRCIFKLFQNDRTYYTLMDSSLSSFKQFARTRKNIAETKRIPFKNLAKVIQGFVKILLEPSVTKKRNLVEKWMLFLKNEENKVFSKNWLLGIAEEFKKK